MSVDDLQQKSEGERTLRALAQVQPPAGLNDRLLRRVREAQLHQELPNRGRRNRWFTVAAVAIVVVAVVAFARLTEWMPTMRPHAVAIGVAPRERKNMVRPDAMAATRPANVMSATGWDGNMHRETHGKAVGTSPASRGAARRGSQTDQISSLAAVDLQPPALNRSDEGGLGHDMPALDLTNIPGERLPRMTIGSVPGQPLPRFEVAAAPGHPLPPFNSTTIFGDQP